MEGMATFDFPKSNQGLKGCRKVTERAFAFSLKEIGRVNPRNLEPIVIFMMQHIEWNIKVIRILRAHIPKLIELLKEKIGMEISSHQE